MRRDASNHQPAPHTVPATAPFTAPPHEPGPQRRSAWRWFVGFLKVGSVSFGGGAPSIPILQRELVDKGVLSKKDFADGLALANVTPGPILTNMAVYAGLRATGRLASLAALAGALLPSLAFMSAATVVFLSYSELPVLKAALHAIQPVVLALLGMTVVKLVPASLTTQRQGVLAALALLALLVLRVHPGIVIVAVATSALLLWRPPPRDIQPGQVYLSVKRLPRLAGLPTRSFVFVAIDSASCWVHMAMAQDNRPETAAAFTSRLMKTAPFKVSSVLIGEHAAFAALPGGFESLCGGLGVDTLVAGQGAPLPHARIEAFNKRLREVLGRLREQPWAMAEQTLQSYAWLHNECWSQSGTTPGATPGTPTESLQKWRASHPQLFTKRRATRATNTA